MISHQSFVTTELWGIGAKQLLECHIAATGWRTTQGQTGFIS